MHNIERLQTWTPQGAEYVHQRLGSASLALGGRLSISTTARSVRESVFKGTFPGAENGEGGGRFLWAHMRLPR